MPRNKGDLEYSASFKASIVDGWRKNRGVLTQKMYAAMHGISLGSLRRWIAQGHNVGEAGALRCLAWSSAQKAEVARGFAAVLLVALILRYKKLRVCCGEGGWLG